MDNPVPFDLNIDFYRWGPIPAKYFFAAGDSIDSFFLDTLKEFGEVWPDSLWLAYGGRVLWLTPYRPIWEHGEELFFSKIMDENERRSIRAAWDSRITDVGVIEQEIARSDLRKLSDEELASLAARFYTALTRYWNWTYFPEIGNYGAEHYLTERLRKELGEAQALKAMEVITAPETFSFYLREEIELSQTNDLKAHQQKYFWLQNSHNGTRVLPVHYFEARKKRIPKDIATISQKNLERTLSKKKSLQNEIGLSDEVMKIARTMAKSIVWQDDRKMNTFISLHYKYLLLQEAARRKGLMESDLLNIHLGELAELLAGKPYDAQLLERRSGVGVWCTKRNVEQLTSADVKTFWEMYADEQPGSFDTDVLSGIIASKGEGLVRARARFLLDPMDPFEEGEVLVTTLTSPEYVFAMRKAAAVVTDTGGVGSHAAITSRELNKPCIVGTKIATKIVRTGDLIEVDTETGVVRVLERA